MSTIPHYDYIRRCAQMSIDRDLDLIKHVCNFLDCPARVEEVQAYFLDREVVKRCLKPKKDVHAPKKPRSSYILYSNSIRKEVTEEFPDLKMHEVSQKFGVRWGSASDELKNEFKVLAEKDKERYLAELEKYTKTLHEQDGSLNGVGASNSC
jgi:CRISPR/Cas system-associated protein Csm6